MSNMHWRGVAHVRYINVFFGSLVIELRVEPGLLQKSNMGILASAFKISFLNGSSQVAIVPSNILTVVLVHTVIQPAPTKWFLWTLVRSGATLLRQ